MGAPYRGIEVPIEWTQWPFAPRCIDPSKASSSVDIVSPFGVAHVYLFIRQEIERQHGTTILEKFYVITYRDKRSSCDAIYGGGYTLDDAIRNAEATWNEEVDIALKAIGLSPNDFKFRFCPKCFLGEIQSRECMYCPIQVGETEMISPIEYIRRHRDEILRVLDDLSPEITWAKTTGHAIIREVR